MNLWDYVILAGVAALLGFAWWLLRRGRKGCPGCCEHCAVSCEQRGKGGTPS